MVLHPLTFITRSLCNKTFFIVKFTITFNWIYAEMIISERLVFVNKSVWIHWIQYLRQTEKTGFGMISSSKYSIFALFDKFTITFNWIYAEMIISERLVFVNKSVWIHWIQYLRQTEKTGFGMISSSKYSIFALFEQTNVICKLYSKDWCFSQPADLN